MIFNIRDIILWCENKTIRRLTFQKNKINIITGESGTGKTAIWSIIDYCLLKSNKFGIPEKTIGENVAWYGIRVELNNKIYTIGRNSFLAKESASKLFYFSGEGQIPEAPLSNIRMQDIRKILEAEFSISNNLKIPYGGKVIRKGSKVSFRYFLLFNAQTQNVIINDEVFFPNQSETRYAEALDRIFDLALTIDTIEEILVREKLLELNKDKARLERKQESANQELDLFHEEISELIRKAKKYLLIDQNISDFDIAYEQLKLLMGKPVQAVMNINNNVNSENDNLHRERIILKRKIKNLEDFNNEYSEYKKSINMNKDSLYPIEFVRENQSELLSDEITTRFIDQLEMQLKEIKEKTRRKSPISIQAEEEILEHKKLLNEVEGKISLFNEKDISPENYERLVIVGEIKAKLSFFKNKEVFANYNDEIDKVEEEIEELSVGLITQEDKKTSFITWLEELIQEYLDESKLALDNYSGYKAVFNYADKTLKLREPGTPNIINTIGSSSNDLFLHLCLFLGLHDLFLQIKSPYVPQFIFLDQPSRPYYDDGRSKDEQEVKGTDREKISIAFKVLNYFMAKVLDRNDSFQMIIVEHIPPEIWEEQGLNNVHLVEEFRGDNYLVNEENKK